MILGIIALVVSALSVLFAYRLGKSADRSASAAENSAIAADRSAAVAESMDHRARQPQLNISLGSSAPAPIANVIYTVRNDGTEDLDEVVVFRPRPSDQIVYPVALTGGPGGGGSDYMDDVSLGGLRLAEEKRFTLAIGAAESLPEFRIRVHVLIGDDEWNVIKVLPAPRAI
jgi:hypothetical protein